MTPTRARTAPSKRASKAPPKAATTASKASTRAEALAFHPLTPERWPDLVALFGPRGACAGCWCMWPRLRGKEFSQGSGDPNRRALERIVRRGDPVGVLAYAAGAPVGWCGVAPREHYPRLAHSRVMAPVDERPVWSVTCFFVLSGWRGRGLSRRLLEQAVRYAGSCGATLVEGYPVDARKRTGDAFVWTGIASTFERAGFHEAARRSPTRPIMRKAVARRRTPSSPARRGR